MSASPPEADIQLILVKGSANDHKAVSCHLYRVEGWKLLIMQICIGNWRAMLRWIIRVVLDVVAIAILAIVSVVSYEHWSWLGVARGESRFYVYARYWDWERICCERC
jgi:hypothetical protein